MLSAGGGGQADDKTGRVITGSTGRIGSIGNGRKASGSRGSFTLAAAAATDLGIAAQQATAAQDAPSQAAARQRGSSVAVVANAGKRAAFASCGQVNGPPRAGRARSG